MKSSCLGVVRDEIHRVMRAELTGDTTDFIDDGIDHLLANGIMTTSICSY